jgi:hypothetical protein
VALHHGVIAPYNIELHLATSMKSWRKLRRTLPELAIPKNPGGGGATVWTADRRGAIDVGHACVFIDVAEYRKMGPLRVGATCAHEAAHVAVFLHEHFNTTVEGEPFAYLVDWLFTWLWERTR